MLPFNFQICAKVILQILLAKREWIESYFWVSPEGYTKQGFLAYQFPFLLALPFVNIFLLCKGLQKENLPFSYVLLNLPAAILL